MSVRRLHVSVNHTSPMADFRMKNPNFWTMACFAMVGCEAAAAWREDSLHLHTPEYSASNSNNATCGASGAFASDVVSPLLL